jgi:dienelactone hydrolase
MMTRVGINSNREVLHAPLLQSETGDTALEMTTMPSKTKFTSGGTDIQAELINPTDKPNGGVIIIAHGTDGITDNLTGPWATMMREYATELAGSGFVALIPDYFNRTGTQPGLVALETIPLHRDAWQATIADASSHAKTLPGVDASRVGLLGFSLGGHLCLRLRATVKALVAFFAPQLDGLGPSGSLTLLAQIHHGEADELVPLKPNAENIVRELRANGASTELFIYSGAGHGFNGNDLGNTNARTLSKQRTLSFFEMCL